MKDNELQSLKDKYMSDDAQERLVSWLKWLPEDSSDEEIDEMFCWWEIGMGPPTQSYINDWMINEKQ